MATTGLARRRSAPIGLGRDGAFLAASAALILVFVSAGAPIPMMASYRATGVDNAAFASASVSYFLSAAVGLTVLGRLSNHIGRRPAGLIALGAAGLGCLVMAAVEGPVWLMVGRGLQGLACGAAPGPLGAFVVDTAGGRRWLPALITGSAPMIGLPLGAVLAGLATHLEPAAAPWILVGWTAALGVCALAVWRAPETVVRSPGAWASLVPRVRLPSQTRGATLVVAAVFVATWPLGGFYQAFGSVVAVDVLGSASPLAAGAIFASIMILNPFGGVLASRMPARRGVKLAMLGYAVVLLGAGMALWEGRAWIFVVASLTCGALQGVAATCAMRLLLPRTRLDDRSDLFAAIYFISYAGVAVAGALAAVLAPHLSLESLAMVYVGLGVLGAIGASLASPKHVPTE